MELIEEIAEFSKDPLGFVYFSFPWGEEGTDLANMMGPEVWQVAILEDLGKGLITLDEAIQLARTSGHGIGKSALVAWIILWAISTFEDTKGVVTANTETQLKTKTWVELAKWYRLFIGRQYFEMTATAIFSTDPEHERTWRIDMVAWSERNTEAFAGLHNQGKRIIVVFDEASAIPDVIWEVTEGALTDMNTEIIWCVFGNPTRNKGRFRDCFQGGRFAHRWKSAAIDSRTVSFTDKKQIARWVEDYGEDHDFVRVRVRGIFPRVDTESFISLELAKAAVERAILPQNGAVVIGVDVGRFGNDPSVIYPRCGRDGVTRPVEILAGFDTMAVAARVAAAFLKYHASVCMVDVGGVGGGVVDRLRQLRIPVIEVDFGSKPDGTNPEDGALYKNKRAEIWGGMREWLKGGAIQDVSYNDVSLLDELTGPAFALVGAGETMIQLEGKKDMRRRGVPSPNIADALACTFAYPSFEYVSSNSEEMKPVIGGEYDPYSSESMYN